jgi:RNA 3'-phosphate cyclase
MAARAEASVRSSLRCIDIDGAYGEGGGQLVRTAVALSAITGTAVRIGNIRAKRDKPGLAPQHVAAVRAVAQFCDAEIENLEVGAGAIMFRPGQLHGGEVTVEIGTAGSITLVMQALLPVMIAAGAPASACVTGGTDVRGAPALDYFREVLLRHVARMGVVAGLRIDRRGYYPRGGGQVRVILSGQRRQALHPLRLDSPGALRRIGGTAHVANLPAHIAARMRASMLVALGETLTPLTHVDTPVLTHAEAIGQGGAVVGWAECEHSVLGACRVAERGVRAEALGEEVGRELRAEIGGGAALDRHAADQILIYLALAGGRSSVSTRAITLHAQTAMWLIEHFLPVRFTSGSRGALCYIDAARA